MKSVETCYTCDSEAVGREHAPPKCIFPRNMRQGIISVPACAKHNHDKKLDDEYFKHVVTSMLEKNSPGMRVLDSVVRSYEQRPHLIGKFLRNARPATDGRGRQTIAYTVDNGRFESTTRFVVRALWFHENGQKLHSDISIHWRALLNNDGTRSELWDMLMDFEKRWPELDYQGAQPSIFQYDFPLITRPSGSTRGPEWLQLCRMRFFEGPPVIAMWHKGTWKR